MRHYFPAMAGAALAVVLAVAAGFAGDQASRPGAKVVVAVFDFACKQEEDLGRKLAESTRIRLRRHEEYEVIDRLTMQETSGPLGLETSEEAVANLMANRLAATVGLYGTVRKSDGTVRAEIRCIDLTDPGQARGWTKIFTDNTERAVAVINLQIAECATGQAEWKPPEYGEEPEPKNFGAPLNVNGDFEKGAAGWSAPDNVSTFIEPGAGGRGSVLRIRTDLARDPWLEYQRKLRFGQADPKNPPKIERDTSYGCVGGLEGVHFRGDWIKATPGQRYWLTTDCKGLGGAKVFVKGFRSTEHALDGMPESSLVERGLTGETFARLPADQRKKLIDEESRKHPDRFYRECYRWYLNCAEAKKDWKHLAAPMPPRGGLPDYVEWLQVQVYAYWPPGEYFFDNVHLYADPNRKAPLPEERPRTPNFGKTSDVVEKASSRKAQP